MNTNDITGARLVTKPNTKEYEDGYDRIWYKKIEDKLDKEERCVIHDNEKVEND